MDEVVFWLITGLTVGVILSAGLFVWMARVAARELDRQRETNGGPVRPVLYQPTRTDNNTWTSDRPAALYNPETKRYR